MNERRPRKRKRLIASAPRKAMTIAAATVTRVTASEIPSARMKPASPNTVAKLSNEPPKGRKVGVLDWRVTLSRKAELIIQ